VVHSNIIVCLRAMRLALFLPEIDGEICAVNRKRDGTIWRHLRYP
jgi:hypothetical protein